MKIKRIGLDLAKQIFQEESRRPESGGTLKQGTAVPFPDYATLHPGHEIPLLQRRRNLLNLTRQSRDRLNARTNAANPILVNLVIGHQAPAAYWRNPHAAPALRNEWTGNAADQRRQQRPQPRYQAAHPAHG